jgi:hypothetical protein
MANHVRVPIKVFAGQNWGDLSSLNLTHEIVGETVHQLKDMSFQGGHRVRLYKFKKNVHWLIPLGVDLDISEVEVPGRKQR